VIIPFFIYFEGAIYPYAMDSPVDPDHLPDFSGGVHHHFLPEDLIIFPTIIIFTGHGS
jgi:hypothetical protein